MNADDNGANGNNAVVVPRPANLQDDRYVKVHYQSGASWLKPGEHLNEYAIARDAAQGSNRELHGKTVAAVVLSLKHRSSSNVNNWKNSTFVANGASIAAKRQRRAQVAAYDRL